MDKAPSPAATEAIVVIGRLIQQQRLLRTMSQDDLAAKTGIHSSSISKIENGKFTHIGTIFHVMAYFDMLDQVVGLISNIELADKNLQRTEITRPIKELVYSVGEALDAVEFEKAIEITPEAIFPVLKRSAMYLRQRGYAIRQTKSKDYLATLPANVEYDGEQWVYGSDNNFYAGGRILLNAHIDPRQFAKRDLAILKNETEELRSYLNSLFDREGLQIYKIKFHESDEHSTVLKRHKAVVKGRLYQHMLTEGITNYLNTEAD